MDRLVPLAPATARTLRWQPLASADRRRLEQQMATLTAKDRQEIFQKTLGRCHVCGVRLVDGRWEADHVLPRSLGGHGGVFNLLPACGTCNRRRSNHTSEEIQRMLAVGATMCREMDNGTELGEAVRRVVEKLR